jgi:hypothetical protein
MAALAKKRWPKVKKCRGAHSPTALVVERWWRRLAQRAIGALSA